MESCEGTATVTSSRGVFCAPPSTTLTLAPTLTLTLTLAPTLSLTLAPTLTLTLAPTLAPTLGVLRHAFDYSFEAEWEVRPYALAVTLLVAPPFAGPHATT